MLLVCLLLLLPHVASSPTSTTPKVDLVEIWDCGPEASKFLSNVAEATLNQCPALKDNVNMCCKNHDFCYATHKENNFTHESCDFKFCGCLQDAQDIYDDRQCQYAITAACKLVKGRIGGWIYKTSNPKNATQLAEKYKTFVDARPLGLNMQMLADQCDNAKGMAIHCHNSAQHCLQRDGSKTMAAHDCMSIMFECLQVLADSNATKPCTSLADRMSRQLTTALAPLDERRIGRTPIEIYPIITARLFQSCPNATGKLEVCLLFFEFCASTNREEKPEMFNAARRVKIGCHQKLHNCVDKSIVFERLDDLYSHADGSTIDVSMTPEETMCSEARRLAIARIRDQPYEEAGLLSALNTVMHRAAKKVASIPSEIVSDVSEAIKSWG